MPALSTVPNIPFYHQFAEKIADDAKVLHIDMEYRDIPVYVNNFNINMDDFFEMVTVITPKQFMKK